MPCQLSNTYGTASFGKIDLDEVWEHLSKPEKIGAKYMTELCNAEGERRGVGISRLVQAIVNAEDDVEDYESSQVSS